MPDFEAYRRRSRTDRVIAGIGFLVLGVLQPSTHILPVPDSPGLVSLRSEIAELTEAIGQLKSDIRVIEKGDEENVRRDRDLAALDNRLLAAEKDLARDDGILAVGRSR